MDKASTPLVKYFTDRDQWRRWLITHFDKSEEVWLLYPKKASGKVRIPYNDAVEEALCFGWIDSTVKSYDAQTTMQRFCPRRKGSSFSQANKERLRRLATHQLLHPSIASAVMPVLEKEFTFPQDIISQIQADPIAWDYYKQFSASYRRIRIAYIDSARKRPEEFKKRLNNFIAKTKANKLIKGYGGIDKYY